jgi:hypothetical protein
MNELVRPVLSKCHYGQPVDRLGQDTAPNKRVSEIKGNALIRRQIVGLWVCHKRGKSSRLHCLFLSDGDVGLDFVCRHHGAA